MRPMFLALCGTAISVSFLGCSIERGTNPVLPSPAGGAPFAVAGRVHGGQQPLAAAHVYVYAVGTTGYAGASTSLLKAGSGTVKDGNNQYYGLTDSLGNFSLAATCSPGEQVYLYSSGGDPGLGGGTLGTNQNAAAGLLAAIGPCPASGALAGTGSYEVNEATTIAMAYALAGFATDKTDISSSNSALAATGVGNAMLNAGQLASNNSGAPLAATPTGNGTAPQATVAMLANALGACINSSGPSSSTCTTLFATATKDGTSSGTKPTDTATAAIYMAQHPFAIAPAPLFALQTSQSPFQPSLTAAPADLTLAILYPGATGFSEIVAEGLSTINTTYIAMDAGGGVWLVTTASPNSYLSHVNAQGANVSNSAWSGSASGYEMGIDGSGNVWFPFQGGVMEFSKTGTFVSPTTGYTCPGISLPRSVSFGSNGLVYVPEGSSSDLTTTPSTVYEFTATGDCQASLGGAPAASKLTQAGTGALDSAGNFYAPLYGSPPSLVYGLTVPVTTNTPGLSAAITNTLDSSLAIDASNHLWTFQTANPLAGGTNAILEYDNSWNLLGTYTGGGLGSYILWLALDGSGAAWVANQAGIAGFTNAGMPITSAQGLTIRNGSGSVKAIPDGSGNLWSLDGDSTLTEFIGLSTPVATPTLPSQLARLP